MGRIKQYLVNLCVSFTAVLLMVSLINDAMGKQVIWFLFGLCILVQVLMYFTDKIPVRSPWVCSLIRIFDICVVVLPLGLSFGMISKDPWDILLSFFIILVTYFIVLGVMVIKDQIDVSQINKKLRQRNHKEENRHESDS